jgi:hypothetical protein
VRLAYRVSYLIFFVSGHLAAWLAAGYRHAAEAAERFGPLVVPMQIALLAFWCPARAVSLGTFALCRTLAPRAT